MKMNYKIKTLKMTVLCTLQAMPKHILSQLIDVLMHQEMPFDWHYLFRQLLANASID